MQWGGDTCRQFSWQHLELSDTQIPQHPLGVLLVTLTPAGYNYTSITLNSQALMNIKHKVLTLDGRRKWVSYCPARGKKCFLRQRHCPSTGLVCFSCLRRAFKLLTLGVSEELRFCNVTQNGLLKYFRILGWLGSEVRFLMLPWRWKKHGLPKHW